MVRDVRELGGAWRSSQQHESSTPSADLAAYVERYWVVRWDYQEPYRQKVVPYPSVQLTFRADEVAVHGVCSGHRTTVLAGRGRVLGVAFRPGCFRPLLRTPVSSITDRSVPAAEVFGPDLPREPDVAAVEQLLRARLPRPEARAEEAVTLTAMIAANPGVTRVEAVARHAGTSVRRLQRLFAEHVGIGPKWVIRRYRLREVTEALAAGEEVRWAALAADLGYADQAHLSRDFSRMFGEPPTRYAARY